MTLQPDNHSGRRKPVPEEFRTIRHYVGAFIFLEVIFATVVVFGLFAAACRPFGRSGILQFLLCTSLGGLLWFVDDKLDEVMKSGATRAIAKLKPQDQLPENDVLPIETTESHPVAAGVARSGK